MSPSNFAVLAGATALSLGLAFWAITDRDVPRASTAPIDRPVFGGLVERLNDLATVRVTSAGTTMTLSRDPQGDWRVVERGDYPASASQVRELALSVAGLQLVEAKTSAEDRLHRLDLADPSQKEAKAKQVEFLDENGAAIADLVVGKSKYGLYGGGRSGVYVRRGGEDQAWLAAGQLDVPSGPLDVVEREIINVQPNELARITLAAGTATPVVLAKNAAADESFQARVPVPPGKRVDPEKLDRLAGSLIALTMQDVKKAGDVDIPPGAPRAVFETWDGVRLEATLAKKGEGEAAEYWVVFAPSQQAPIGKPPVVEEGQVGPKPAADRIRDLAARVDGYAFKLSEYLATRLAWGTTDLLTDAAPQG